MAEIVKRRFLEIFALVRGAALMLFSLVAAIVLLRAREGAVRGTR